MKILWTNHFSLFYGEPATIDNVVRNNFDFSDNVGHVTLQIQSIKSGVSKSN